MLLHAAGIVRDLCTGVAKYCPQAWVAIISNPVNSTVPIAAEVFKRYAHLPAPCFSMSCRGMQTWCASERHGLN